MWFPLMKKEEMFRTNLEDLITETEKNYYVVKNDLEKLVS